MERCRRVAPVFLGAILAVLPAAAQAPPPPPAAPAPAPTDPDSLRRDLDAARRDLQTTRALLQKKQQDDDRLRREMDEQRQRIETLESKMNSVVQKEDVKDRRPKTGLLSIHNEWLDLGGVFQAEYVEVENETRSAADATDAPAGHFQIEKFTLIPKITVTEDVELRAELEFRPRNGNSAFPDNDPEGRAYLNEAQAVVRHLPGRTWVQVGMDERFIAPDRKTETFPLAGTAFWRDDTIGITFGGEPFDFVYWRASVTNGLRLMTHGVNEDKSFEILHDDRTETDLSNAKEIGFGIGGRYAHDVIGKFDVMAFFFEDRLDRGERALLRAIPGYGASDDRNRVRAGVNFDYSLSGFDFFAQFVGARDGDLNRLAWYMQPSYRWTFEGLRWLQSLTLLYRYNRYEADITPVASNSLTWDRLSHTPAILVELVPFVTLKFEYNFNQEDSELGSGVDNDEFLAEFEVVF